MILSQYSGLNIGKDIYILYAGGRIPNGVKFPRTHPHPECENCSPCLRSSSNKASPDEEEKVAWPDLSAGGGCLSPNLGLSPLPLALGPATGSSTTASTLPPGRLSGRTRGAETLKSQANQKMKKVRSIKKKSGRTRGVETNNSNKH